MNLAQLMGGKGGNLVFLRASSGPRLGSGGRCCGERSCGKGHRRGRCRDHRDEERGAWGDGDREGGRKRKTRSEKCDETRGRVSRLGSGEAPGEPLSGLDSALPPDDVSLLSPGEDVLIDIDDKEPLIPIQVGRVPEDRHWLPSRAALFSLSPRLPPPPSSHSLHKTLPL